MRSLQGKHGGRVQIGYFLILLTVGNWVAAQGQTEHAPTIEQCRADQRLWRSQQDDFFAKENGGNEAAANGTDVGRVTFDTLNTRAREMNDCVSVDPQNTEKYRDVRNDFEFMQHNRLVSFLKRHDLWRQFIEEDRDRGLR